MNRLSDIERKTQTIIYNMCSFGKTPSVKNLCIKTGRDRVDLLPVLNKLVDMRRIKWITTENVMILPLPAWYERNTEGNRYG